MIKRTEGSVYIVNLTVPFEARPIAFARAKVQKLEKHQSIVDFYAEQNICSEVDAFLVGSLGSWDPDNAFSD